MDIQQDNSKMDIHQDSNEKDAYQESSKKDVNQDHRNMDVNKNNPFAKIPVEVLRHIVFFLPAEDAGNLRLACKDINHSMLDSFSRLHFGTKQFMLDRPSLTDLIEMSEHPVFSPDMKQIIIVSKHYARLKVDLYNDLNDLADDMYDGPQLRDQQHLWRIKHDQVLLRDAFRKLPNLESIGIRGFDTTIKHHWNSTWTDMERFSTYQPRAISTGESMTWADYDVIDVPWANENRPKDFSFLEHMMVNVLAAAAKANARPKKLEAAFGRHGVKDSGFSISDDFRPLVEPLLQNPRIVHVDLYLDTGLDVNTNSCPLFQALLATTTRLEWLRLSIERPIWRPADQLLFWLSARHHSDLQPFPGQYPKPIPFEHLEHLELGRVIARLEVLMAVVRKLARSLKKLNLAHIELRDNLAVPGDERNAWKQLLQYLAVTTTLENFRLCNPNVSTNFRMMSSPVEYNRKLLKPSAGSMSEFLEDLANNMWIWQGVGENDQDDVGNEDDNGEEDEPKPLREGEGDSEYELEFDVSRGRFVWNDGKPRPEPRYA